jgi:hypothetical protein
LRRSRAASRLVVLAMSARKMRGIKNLETACLGITG